MFDFAMRFNNNIRDIITSKGLNIVFLCCWIKFDIADLNFRRFYMHTGYIHFRYPVSYIYSFHQFCFCTKRLLHIQSSFVKDAF